MISPFWNLKHAVIIKYFGFLQPFDSNLSLFLYLKNRSQKVFFSWIGTVKWSKCCYWFFKYIFKLLSEIVTLLFFCHVMEKIYNGIQSWRVFWCQQDMLRQRSNCFFRLCFLFVLLPTCWKLLEITQYPNSAKSGHQLSFPGLGEIWPVCYLGT